MLLEESLYELSDELLLTSWESDGLLEDTLKLANGSRSANLCGLISEEVFNVDAERFGEPRENI